MPETYQADSELSQRYASAFLELAVEQKCVEACAEDLRSLAQALQLSTDLKDATHNPAYSNDELTKAFDAIMKHIKAQELSCKFVRLLIQRRRLRVLSSVIAAFLQNLAAARGEVHTEVITATALSVAESKKLNDILRNTVSKNVIVDIRQDESLIGGFIVRVGSKMIDASTKTQLLTLANSMKG